MSALLRGLLPQLLADRAELGGDGIVRHLLRDVGRAGGLGGLVVPALAIDHFQRVPQRFQLLQKDLPLVLEKLQAQRNGVVSLQGQLDILPDVADGHADCRVRPMVNQILLHITNTDLALVDFCRKNDIQIEAYSPIAHGEALKNPAIAKMAEKYGVSAAQLCIRYAIQLGTVALPKTANPGHMKSNADVDFAISEEDMQTLLHMERIADYGEFGIFPVFSGKPLA